MVMARKRKREREMEAKAPKWLPDGWIPKLGVDESGAKFKYYLAPVSGHKFRTKKEVLDYLTVIKDGNCASEITSCSGDNDQIHLESSQELLPPGWILEIRVRVTGRRAGEKYKCYYDPVTGSSFYSKADVFRFLESGNLSTQTPKQKRHSRGISDNVVAQIEYSPDGLPHGWVKETIFRKSTGRIKKDPFYTDPVHGYVFRSFKEAIHYVSTGKAKNVSCPKRKSISESNSPLPIPVIELKSLRTTLRRCGLTEEEVHESTERVPRSLACHLSSESVEKADSTYLSRDMEHIKPETELKTDPTADNTSEASNRAENKCKSVALARRSSKRLAGCKPEQASENMLESSKHTAKSESKSVTMSSRVLKRLAGWEPEQASENMFGTSNRAWKRKLISVTVPIRASKRLAGCELEQASENMVETAKHVMKSERKSVTMPSQASKQLAECERERVEKNKSRGLTEPIQLSNGCEPEPPRESKRPTMSEPALVAESITCACNGESQDATHGTEEQVPLGEPENPPVSNDEPDETKGEADDRPPAVPVFPFLKGWADPCIEFAVKTLMGDIPGFGDIDIAGFVPAPTTNPSSSVVIRPERLQNQQFHVDTDNRLPSGGNATKTKAEGDGEGDGATWHMGPK